VPGSTTTTLIEIFTAPVKKSSACEPSTRALVSTTTSVIIFFTTRMVHDTELPVDDL
jgi:hypothetical protein